MNTEHANWFRRLRRLRMNVARESKKRGLQEDVEQDLVAARWSHQRAMMFGHPHKLEEWLEFQKTVEPWEWYADDVMLEIADAEAELDELYQDERDTQASNRPPQ